MRRGDVVTLQGDLGRPRPALLIQSDLFDAHPSVTILPITSQVGCAVRTRRTNCAHGAPYETTKLANHSLKMPQLAMPVRVMLVGQTHTPSVDAVISLFTREVVLGRMGRFVS